MNLKELNKIADANSVSLDLSKESGIVAVTFQLNGAMMQCLYSCDVQGLFAFTIEDPDTFFSTIGGES